MRKLKYHIYGALIYSGWVLGLDVLYHRGPFRWPLELMALADTLWIFYSGYAVLYFFFLCKGVRRGYGIPVLMISLSGTYLINFLYYNVVHLRYDPTHYSSREIMYTSSQEYSYFFIYSIGYLFAVRFVQRQTQVRLFERQQAEDRQARLELEKQNALLQHQKLLLEKDLVQTENNFLRAQISPHFLYNCLNFLYSEIFETQPKVADAILMLAQIMRYSLTDFSATNGLASLQAEIDHIHNVIEMHRMRFGYSLQLDFVTEGDAADKLIAPMVLITLVENVLKHGDLHDQAFPARIRCRIDARQKLVWFSTENKKGKKRSELCSGIGLGNIQQRLAKIYGDKFQLSVCDESSVYREELAMPYLDRIPLADTIPQSLNFLLC
jgi:sensor histidine kinase YesM